jgi:hypothetical protein
LRQGAKPNAAHHDRHRQGGEARVRGQHGADDAAVAAITVLLPPASACAIASTSALRLAMRSSAKMGAISAITDIDEFPAESMIPKSGDRFSE